MNKSIIKSIIEKFTQLKSERSNWDNSWQKISELVNTKKADFITTQTKGEFLNNKVFNNQAQLSVKSRASTIKSMILGDYDFKLEPVNKYINNDKVVGFFQEATDILKEELKNSQTGFNKTLSQSEEFDATFGTSVVYCDYSNHLNFKCLDLKECYIDENYTGNIDTLYRKFTLTIRQAIQQFGLENLSEQTQKDYNNGQSNIKIDLLNCIVPISDFKELFDLKNEFEYVSIFIETAQQHLIGKEGYYSKPFFVHREGQKVGEKYGRGASYDAMSTISQLNAITKNLMLIVNRQGVPPLGMYDDKQFIDLSAGAVNRFKLNANSSNPIFNMINETGRPEIISAYIQALEEKVTSFYSLDRLLDFNSGGTQMTATEVNARSKIRNSTLSDLFQTKIDEKYTPLIVRSFNLLFSSGLFDELIEKYKSSLESILNSEIDIYKVSYYNQIQVEKKSQEQNLLLNMWNVAGQIAGMTQDMAVFDNLDYDKTMNAFKTTIFTNSIFRNQPDVEILRTKRREQVEKQQALAMVTEAGTNGQ